MAAVHQYPLLVGSVSPGGAMEWALVTSCLPHAGEFLSKRRPERLSTRQRRIPAGQGAANLERQLWHRLGLANSATSGQSLSALGRLPAATST